MFQEVPREIRLSWSSVKYLHPQDIVQPSSSIEEYRHCHFHSYPFQLNLKTRLD